MKATSPEEERCGGIWWLDSSIWKDSVWRENVTCFCLSERGRREASGEELHWSWLKFFYKEGISWDRNPWRLRWTLFLELLKYSQGTCNCVRIPELLYFPLHPLCQMEWDWASAATEKEFGSLFPEAGAQRVHGTLGLKSEMVTLCHHVLFLPTADILNDHKTLFCCIRITSEFFSTQYAVIIRIGTHMKPMCHLFFRTNFVGFMLRKTVISINAL